MKKHTRTKQPAPAAAEALDIHTPLTMDDRDALDLLKHRIQWQAMLVQHTLATWNEENDLMEDRDRPTLQIGLIELCASIVRDTDAMQDALDLAANRDDDPPRPKGARGTDLKKEPS